MTPVQISQYFERIGYTGPNDASIAQLQTLQELHLTRIPYENLDIMAGKPISLVPDALFDKIVTRRRGGFCFELNALFAELLSACGYEVTSYFARFLLGSQGIPMRRHQVLRVRAQGQDYLADVGVGLPVPRRSLRLEESTVQEQFIGTYRFTRDALLGWILWELHKGQWRKLYSFTEEVQLPVDFVATSYYCQYAPESIFNKQDMVALGTPTGRITLDGDTLKVFDGESVTVTALGTRAEKEAALMRCFGLVL